MRLRHKYYAPQVRPNWDSNSSPLDHESTFQVTETPADADIFVEMCLG